MDLSDLKFLFPTKIRQRGQAYSNNGNVTILQISSEFVQSIVSSERSTYEINLELSDESVIAGSCTCPYAQNGKPCKHMWATLLQIEDTHVDQADSSWEMQLHKAPAPPPEAAAVPDDELTTEFRMTYVVPLASIGDDGSIPLTVYRSPRLKSGKFGILKLQELVEYRFRNSEAPRITTSFWNWRIALRIDTSCTRQKSDYHDCPPHSFGKSLPPDDCSGIQPTNVLESKN